MRSPAAFILFLAVSLSFCGLAVSQETDVDEEHPGSIYGKVAEDSSSAKPTLAFGIDGGDSSEVFIAQLRESAQKVAAEKGYRPEELPGAEVPGAVKEKKAAAGVVITVSQGEGGLEAEVAIHGEGSERREKRNVTHASAAAQVRAMMRSMLKKPAAAKVAETSPQSSPAMPEKEDDTESDFVGTEAPMEAPTHTPAPANSPTIPRGVGKAPPRPSEGELSSIPPGRTIAKPPRERGKVAAVFGGAVGFQAGTMYAGSMLLLLSGGFSSNDYDSDSGSNSEDEDYKVYIGAVGGYLAISPAISSVIGWAIGKRTYNYEVRYGHVAGGAYIGALGAFAVSMIGYATRDPFTSVLGFIIAPAFLPAIGAAVGYKTGRKPKRGVIKLGMNRQGEPALSFGKKASWSLPKPVVMKSMDGSRGAHVGVTLGRLTF